MATVDDFLFELQRTGITGGAALCRALKVSAPTLGRLVTRAGGKVLRIGKTRGARYALTRTVEGLGLSAPAFRISASGKVEAAGTLRFLARGANWLETGDKGEFFEGLPPWAADMSPQGYLGYDFAARYPELALPPRLADWTDDHRLLALARRGEDCVGNVIFGKESLDRWLASRHEPLSPSDFPRLARESVVMRAGSSAGGEQPKFLGIVGGKHCIVKFAGGDSSPAAQRWRDLLACEHLALDVLAKRHIPAATSRVVDREGMRFLVVERFDRIGLRGRRGVLSLFALDNEHVGAGGSWTSLSQKLEQAGLCSSADARRLRWLDVFAQLIGNSDRHLGNISFFQEGNGKWSLCPVYDMLPMLLAPVQTTVVERPFEPRGPTADTLDVWEEAAQAAEHYLGKVASLKGVSAKLRTWAKNTKSAVTALSR